MQALLVVNVHATSYSIVLYSTWSRDEIISFDLDCFVGISIMVTSLGISMMVTFVNNNVIYIVK